jgi:outer membrane receptor protein involved in Fe transport
VLALAVAGSLLAIGWVAMPASARADAEAAAEPAPRRPAVARMNLRVGAGYSFLHVDETETTQSGAALSTLRVPEHDAHAAQVHVVGVTPLTRSTGARIRFDYRQGEDQRSLDGLDRGTEERASYGVTGELFVRDPEMGSFSFGGGYDYRDADGGVDADAFRGNVAAAIFFPDLGSGPVDWFVRFDFEHREVSGVSGTTADIDADRYVVTGGAGWYLSPDFLFVLGGRWDRAEEEFLTEETSTGFGRFRIGLPVPGPISVELSLGGSAGVAELDRSPFRSDKRIVYGAEAGLVFRYRSGATLLDAIRGHD